MNRRTLLLLAAAAASASLPAMAKAAPSVEVFKNAGCLCCDAWAEHLRAAGFAVKVHEVPDAAAERKRRGIPDRFGSCHTGVVAGYALEGHVPAREVKRLLAEKPAAAGLSVPGMPVGSPGMEAGSRKDAFQVLLIDKAGNASVFATYPAS